MVVVKKNEKVLSQLLSLVFVILGNSAKDCLYPSKQE